MPISLYEVVDNGNVLHKVFPNETFPRKSSAKTFLKKNGYPGVIYAFVAVPTFIGTTSDTFKNIEVIVIPNKPHPIDVTAMERVVAKQKVKNKKG